MYTMPGVEGLRFRLEGPEDGRSSAIREGGRDDEASADMMECSWRPTQGTQDLLKHFARRKAWGADIRAWAPWGSGSAIVGRDSLKPSLVEGNPEVTQAARNIAPSRR